VVKALLEAGSPLEGVEYPNQVFRREVQGLDDDLPVLNLRTMEEQLERQIWPYRVFGSLFAIFAAIALLLASVGLYAVIAHSVNQRTQEIGVRMALGATGNNVLRLVFSQGMRQLAVGLVIGLAAAPAVTKVLKSLLVDVSPSDPATFVSVTLVLVIAAAVTKEQTVRLPRETPRL
jgi:putative ABC transport system permease protein